MAKYCPVIKEKVLYTECIECKTKECKKSENKIKEPREYDAGRKKSS